MQKRSSRKGSLTVEASLVFPIFILAVLAFLYLFRFISAEYEIERSVFTAEREITSLGGLTDVVEKFLPETDDVLSAGDAVAVGIMVADGIDDRTAQMIDGGLWGMDFFGSKLFEDDRIIIECSYSLKVPFLLFGNLTIPVHLSSTYRYFNGHEVPFTLSAVEGEDEQEEDGDEDYVLITETGKVYHVCAECPTLKITVSEVLAGSVESKRNKSGAKYYPCEKCAKGEEPSVLYITSEGNRYHYKRDCSGLKRTVSRIPKSEAIEKGYRICKRCPQEE